MASPASSLFAAVEMAPRDPILGLNEQFAADTNPAKVNLGVGVYYDENGKLPILQCVLAAEKQLAEAATPEARWQVLLVGHYDTVYAAGDPFQQPRWNADGTTYTVATDWVIDPTGGTTCSAATEDAKAS